MNFDIEKATIFLVLAGSRAYGIENENSDFDYRGICIAPLTTYLVGPKFEQTLDKNIYKKFPENLIKPDSDIQIMELSKFIKLALEGNPSILEILFSDDENILLKIPLMNKLLENKHLFLSKIVKARFSGYAISQIHKMKLHKTHNEYPCEKPKREDFGLPEYSLISQDQLGAAQALIDKEINGFILDQTDFPEHLRIEIKNGLGKMMRSVWESINLNEEFPIGKNKKFEHTVDALQLNLMKKAQFSENFIEVLSREKRYRAKLQEYNQYKTWLNERNEKRAELEKKFGYDTKFAVHTIRLLKQCREILETGNLSVKSPWAKELKEIRNGSWKYEDIISFAENEDKELTELVKKSKLPNTPPINKINDIVYEMITEFNNVK